MNRPPRLGASDCHTARAAYSSYEHDAEEIRLCSDCTKIHHTSLVGRGWSRAAVDLDQLVATPKEA